MISYYYLKQGLITLNEANKMIDSKWSDVERAFKTTKLPTVPNTDKIYKFVKEVYNDVLNK